MIVAGGIKVIADNIDFYCIGQTSRVLVYDANFQFYFYGSMTALFAGGILHDKLFYCKSYFTLFLLNTVTFAA
jgi:hypothetical protein